MEGIIFDIQKFALHDGPGIRTVVFLKGCPLYCIWCCNPESQKLQPQISYEPAKCIGCLHCVTVCPLTALKPDDIKVKVNFADCSACGQCLGECAANALRIHGYKTNVEKIIEEVMKDKAYFDNSGGGLTLSGGEAMIQFEFALELFRLAKNQGLHTAIETSGYAATEKFAQIRPYIDLFLFDYKHTGNQLHKKYTGVEQYLILKNLDYLYLQGAKILIRCPVIPGINDTRDHFLGICEISRKYPNLKGIEILGYHDYGVSKYGNIGLSAHPIASKAVSQSTVKQWIATLQQMGCSNLIQ
jgi:pyruvate formate lyase activating enzyme